MATKETQKQNTRGSATSQQTKPRAIQQVPPLTISDDALYERVAGRAYELYQARGEDHGHDLADWFTAEQLVKEELLHGPVPEEPFVVER